MQEPGFALYVTILYRAGYLCSWLALWRCPGYSKTVQIQICTGIRALQSRLTPPPSRSPAPGDIEAPSELASTTACNGQRRRPPPSSRPPLAAAEIPRSTHKHHTGHGPSTVIAATAPRPLRDRPSPRQGQVRARLPGAAPAVGLHLRAQSSRQGPDCAREGRGARAEGD